jgi:hypothetical protein
MKTDKGVSMKKSLLLVSMFSASLTSTAFAANTAISEQALSTIKQLAAKPKLVQAVTKINTQRQADGRKVLNNPQLEAEGL